MRAMPIVRSRTGCFTCRRRKKKCNEEKPVCSGCERNKLECAWPADSLAKRLSPSQRRDKALSQISKPVFSGKNLAGQGSPEQSIDPEPLAQSSRSSRSATAQPTESSHDLAIEKASPSSVNVDDSFQNSPGSPVTERDEAQNDSDETLSASSPLTIAGNPADTVPSIQSSSQQCTDTNNAYTVSCVSRRESPVSFAHGNIPINMSLLPSHGHDSFELLSFYLARTASSMGNGCTDTNPFVAQLIPLAFSHPLVLHLILAQSAVHRQASKDGGAGDEVATRYYTDSLRMFRNLICEYISGKEDNNLVVTLGSLILCLTEVAKGDANGTIFDHLTASNSLLTSLLDRYNANPFYCNDLPDFLVEYYMHVVACSIISKDPKDLSRAALSPTIENAARRLVANNYMGQLCGCWLDILTLIPQVYQLGRSIRQPTNEEPTALTSPDEIINFGLLQSQILAFMPSTMATFHSQLAGLVFKQATLLYLWSIFGTPQQQQHSTVHSNLMQSAVMEAISLLRLLPASERVNTSLCWPLTVIGCCTTDAEVQHVLRGRLHAMIDTIGLGNIRQTLTLLEHVWEQPPERVSPWTLRNIMEQYHIWISFA